MHIEYILVTKVFYIVECGLRDLSVFEYENYRVLYPKSYFHFLKEVFILDVYRTNLLKPNDIVLDLGASTGDFCIIASKKVGENGKVIALEPNNENYEILTMNIKENNCKNIVAINQGVGNECTEKQITFWDRTFTCKMDTLENILENVNMKDNKVNFIKMDIEGFEAKVIEKSIQLIKQADVISLEFHYTKDKIDKILLHEGFLYEPITMRYIYKKTLNNLLKHPYTVLKAYTDTVADNPSVIQKGITGFDSTKGQCTTGSYIKASS